MKATEDTPTPQGGLLCQTCNTVKPISEFRADSSRNAGVKQPCKDCDNKRGAERQAVRRKRSGYPEYINAKIKEWRLKHPEKYAAQVKARIYKKQLKGKYCEICLSEKDLHMHHPDYSKPLEVVTLCRNCHENIHHNPPKDMNTSKSLNSILTELCCNIAEDVRQNAPDYDFRASHRSKAQAAIVEAVEGLIDGVAETVFDTRTLDLLRQAIKEWQ